jgi:CheY-like chemotaxis protein
MTQSSRGGAWPDPSIAKILLVDDRRENLVALEAMLQGLRVETVGVTSGETALKQLLMDDFSVILLDAQMPGMDGFETARQIKNRPRTRQIPIIFLTAADGDARLALRGYAAGAVDYLTKPFDPWILRAKVSVLVDLWAKTRQLQEQADHMNRLAAAAEEALDALRADRADRAARILDSALQSGSAATTI